MKNLQLAALLIAIFSVTAVQGEDLDYSFIDVGWVSTEFDAGSFDVDGDSFEIDGSIALADRVHAIASFSFGNFDFGVDVNSQSVGVGYNTPLTDSIDFVASGEIIRVDIQALSASDDDTGFGINLGIRGLASKQFEYSGFLNYVDVNDSDFGVTFNGIYYLAPQWGIGAGVSLADDTTAFGLFGRYYFQK